MLFRMLILKWGTISPLDVCFYNTHKDKICVFISQLRSSSFSMSHFILFMTSIHLYILKLGPIPVDRSDIASPSQDWPQIKERQAIINANMHTYHQFWVTWKSKEKGFWILQFNQLDLRFFFWGGFFLSFWRHFISDRESVFSSKNNSGFSGI